MVILLKETIWVGVGTSMSKLTNKLYDIKSVSDLDELTINEVVGGVDLTPKPAHVIAGLLFGIGVLAGMIDNKK